MRFSLDTSILVYAVDAASGPRHDRALELLGHAARADCVLMLQTFGEFFHVATRKDGLDAAIAERLVHRWLDVFETRSATEPELRSAMAIAREHGLSYWDALLWATVEAAGCSVLFTEDLQDGRKLGRVTFVDPFRAANEALVNLALNR